MANPRKAAAESDFMAVRDAAKRLGVHENTIRNMVNDGRLSAARIAGSNYRRVSIAEVDLLVKQMKAQAPLAYRVSSGGRVRHLTLPLGPAYGADRRALCAARLPAGHRSIAPHQWDLPVCKACEQVCETKPRPLW